MQAIGNTEPLYEGTLHINEMQDTAVLYLLHNTRYISTDFILDTRWGTQNLKTNLKHGNVEIAHSDLI